MYQVLKESVSKRGNRKKDATSPGWKKTGTSTPRLTWLRIFRGKAQPSRGVSSLVPDLCPTPPCRVRRKREGKDPGEKLAFFRKDELCRPEKNFFRFAG